LGQPAIAAALKTPRVFVDPPLQEGQQLPLDSAISHHLLRVLRLGSGEIITVCDGQGNDYRAKLLGPRGQGRQQVVWVELGSVQPNQAEASRQLHLGVAATGGERFERMLEQLAELGVATITPLFTERSNARQLGEPKIQRWRRLALEACQLAGRGTPLRILAPQRLSQFLAEDVQGFVLHQESPPGPARLDCSHLVVGPEGGFSRAEIKLAVERGWQCWSLGPRNLRVETAAVVGAVLCLH
jgi:16S rRNA (uracil1498-N3)-methyltransferase